MAPHAPKGLALTFLPVAACDDTEEEDEEEEEEEEGSIVLERLIDDETRPNSITPLFFTE